MSLRLAESSELVDGNLCTLSLLPPRLPTLTMPVPPPSPSDRPLASLEVPEEAGELLPPKFLGNDLFIEPILNDEHDGDEHGDDGKMVLRSEDDWEQDCEVITVVQRFWVELPADITSLLLSSVIGFSLKSTANVLNADAGVV